PWWRRSHDDVPYAVRHAVLEEIFKDAPRVGRVRLSSVRATSALLPEPGRVPLWEAKITAHRRLEAPTGDKALERTRGIPETSGCGLGKRKFAVARTRSPPRETCATRKFRSAGIAA